MRQVAVADTSPLNYLVQIDAIALLPRLFSQVIIPPAVVEELLHSNVPESVRRWLATSPSWLARQTSQASVHDFDLDRGETEAITLALEINQCSLLIDERKARQVAIERRIPHIGTLGLLIEAGGRSWINFDEYVERLCRTNFRVDDELLFEARRRVKIKRGEL